MFHTGKKIAWFSLRFFRKSRLVDSTRCGGLFLFRDSGNHTRRPLTKKVTSWIAMVSSPKHHCSSVRRLHLECTPCLQMNPAVCACVSMQECTVSNSIFGSSVYDCASPNHLVCKCSNGSVCILPSPTASSSHTSQCKIQF